MAQSSPDDFPMIYEALITEIVRNYNSSPLTKTENKIEYEISYSENHKVAIFYINKKNHVRMCYQTGVIHFVLTCQIGPEYQHNPPTSSGDWTEQFAVDIADPFFFKKCNRVLRIIMKMSGVVMGMESDPNSECTFECVWTMDRN